MRITFPVEFLDSSGSMEEYLEFCLIAAFRALLIILTSLVRFRQEKKLHIPSGSSGVRLLPVLT